MNIEEEVSTKVLLVGVDDGEEQDFDHSMEELKSLAEACGKEVVGIITQKLDTVNKALYLGAGKVAEAKEFAGYCGAEEVIFDNTLSPSQIRNLVQELDLPVSDRTGLILDIFAMRARSKEAKLQVESARLQYMLPRLVGLRDSLGRQGGASGSMSNKGAGEKKLELDRRRIEHRISELNKELEEISGNRKTQRKRRSESRVPQVALVGYTNAGKSTIFNKLVERWGDRPEKTVLAQDMLFATLETSVRYLEMEDKKPFFIADTVGFIHKLPHSLIKAFRATLEEVRYADLLIHVVDYSDESYRQQMQVTEDTLKELEAGDIPRIIVYNKCDRRGEEVLPRIYDDRIHMAAGSDIGINELCDMIKARLYADNVDCVFEIPYDKGGLVSYFMENASVKEQEYNERGVRLQVNCRKSDAAKYAEYVI